MVMLVTILYKLNRASSIRHNKAGLATPSSSEAEDDDATTADEDVADEDVVVDEDVVADEDVVVDVAGSQVDVQSDFISAEAQAELRDLRVWASAFFNSTPAEERQDDDDEYNDSRPRKRQKYRNSSREKMDNNLVSVREFYLTCLEPDIRKKLSRDAMEMLLEAFSKVPVAGGAAYKPTTFHSLLRSFEGGEEGLQAEAKAADEVAAVTVIKHEKVRMCHKGHILFRGKHAIHLTSHTCRWLTRNDK